MSVGASRSLFDRQLHAEVRRILRLLERTRQTRRQVRRLVTLSAVNGRPARRTPPRRSRF